MSIAEAAQAAVDKVHSMNEELGTPPQLSAVGVRAELIPSMATDAMKSGNIPLNPRPTIYEDIVAIYEAACEHECHDWTNDRKWLLDQLGQWE